MTLATVNRAVWPGPIQELYRRRWCIWIVAILAHTIGMFHRAAMAPVADRLMADFNISAAVFGSLGAAYFYIYAAMQLPSGTLADTLGPRKTLTAGLLLSILGSLVMGLAPSFGVIYVGRLMVSFGVSVAWLSVVKVIMGWFWAREVATMTGLSVAVAHLGQIAAATPLALLVMWAGWRMSFVAIAGLSLVLVVAIWLAVKDSPAQAGLPTIAEFEGESAAQVPESGACVIPSVAERFKMVVANKQLWPLVLVGLGSYGSYSTLFHNWVVIYLMQVYDVQRDFAANLVLVAGLGIMLGAPTFGFLSDRILQRRLPLVMSTGLSLVCLVLLTLWNAGKPPLAAVYPLCFFIGFGTGAVPITFACVRDIVPSSVRGMASGLVNMGAFVGAAVIQPLFGYVLDLGWEGKMVEGARVYPLGAFQQSLMLCCGLITLGFLGALLVRETRCLDRAAS